MLSNFMGIAILQVKTDFFLIILTSITTIHFQVRGNSTIIKKYQSALASISVYQTEDKYRNTRFINNFYKYTTI